jgi:hypothetical protein
MYLLKTEINQTQQSDKLLICRAQMLMKARLKGAQKGHSLLKKKADALQMRFRMILSKIIEVSRKKLIKNITIL